MKNLLTLAFVLLSLSSASAPGGTTFFQEDTIAVHLDVHDNQAAVPYTSPSFTGDPVELRMTMSTFFVAFAKWENLDSQSLTAPSGYTGIRHSMFSRRVTNPSAQIEFMGPATLRTWMYVNTYQAFDGIIDGDGLSGSSHTWAGFPTGSIWDVTKTIQWSSLSEAEKTVWRNGRIFSYQPRVNYVNWDGRTSHLTGHTWFAEMDEMVTCIVRFDVVY